jgi:hypothetical protein
MNNKKKNQIRYAILCIMAFTVGSIIAELV